MFKTGHIILERKRKKMYRVIFNKDESNYEEFETLEKAEEFAKRYANTEIEIKKI